MWGWDGDMTNIAHYRKLRGMSQGDLAQMVGVSQPHISRAEKGDDGPPLRLFREIAEALGVSLADLFSDRQDQTTLMLADSFRRSDDRHRKLILAMVQQVEAVSQADPEDPPATQVAQEDLIERRPTVTYAVGLGSG